MTFEENKIAPTEAATSDQGVTKVSELTKQYNTKLDDIAIFHLGMVSGLTVENPNRTDIDYHVNRLYEYIKGVK